MTALGLLIALREEVRVLEKKESYLNREIFGPEMCLSMKGVTLMPERSKNAC